MSRYTIEGETLTGLADAIREMRYERDEMTPAQMEAKIRATKIGIPIDVSVHVNPETGKWERPEEYPDLDVLAEQIGETESCVYMTYDLRKTPGYAWIGLYARCSASNQTINFERGHIENGEFVVDEAHPVSSVTYTFFRQPLDSENGDIQIWRVSTTGNITRYGFCPNTTTTANNYYNGVQPCVERVGNLPYISDIHPDGGGISVSQSYICYATCWLERDALSIGSLSSITNISNAFTCCYNLQELDMSGWTNTGNWRPTSLLGMFNFCFFLRSLDLSGWDTSNWSITTLQNAFSYCSSLESLDLSSWDTENWSVTTMYQTFYGCFSLKNLNLSGWDTSNWTVSTLYATWGYCYSLKELDLSGWDTESWTLTSMYQTFYSCYSLKNLNLSGWDTSNWAVNTLGYTWYSCYSLLNADFIKIFNTSSWVVTALNATFGYCRSLKELDLSGWDTSNWNVTTLASMFAGCHSAEKIDLTGWYTNGWTVTTLASMFSDCWSLKELDLSGWNTSNWAVTTLASFCSGCYSLESIDITGWDTSNWEVTTLASLFASCHNLKEINLNGWDTSNWPVTSLYYLFAYNRSLRSIDISSWDTTRFAVTDTRTMVGDDVMLESAKFPSGNWAVNNTNVNAGFNGNRSIKEVSGYKVFVNHSYSACYFLTPASVAQILIDLPQVSVARTITLGAHNKNKVTAEQIAVATQKGWTVAT